MAWLGRIVLAIGFLAVVLVVTKSTVQGQLPESGKIWLPQVARTAVYTLNPPLKDYMGLVGIREADPDKTTYYTVRGDGSAWTELVDNVFVERVAWSPDGAYFVSVRGTDGEEGVWLTRLSDRYSWQLANIEGAHFFWSSDSRRLIFYTYQYLYQYDLSTETLTTFPVINDSHGGNTIFWSPDSRSFAWWVQMEHDWPHPALAQLYIVMDGQDPLLVFTGYVDPEPIQWSFDSQKVLFNVWDDEDASWSVYESNLDGTAVRQLSGGHQLVGFIENGTRLLLLSENALFLANSDGSEPTIFANDISGGIFYSPSIAPTGDKILYDSFEGMVLKRTTGNMFLFEEYTLDNPQWRSDGELFTLNLSSPVGTGLLSANFNDPGLKQEFTSDSNPHFLPLSESYLTISQGYYDFSPGYPMWVFEGTHLFDTHLGTSTPLIYPYSDEAMVIEWRYIP